MRYHIFEDILDSFHLLPEGIFSMRATGKSIRVNFTHSEDFFILKRDVGSYDNFKDAINAFYDLQLKASK